MNEATLKGIGIGIFWGGLVLFGAIGLAIGGWLIEEVKLVGLLSGMMLWLTIYLVTGIQIVPEQEAWVIERLGKKLRILRKGIRVLCFSGFLDKIRTKETLRLVRLDLFKDEPRNEVDFANDSAPVMAQVWFRIIDEDASIYNYVYNTEDPRNYIEEQVDDYMRPEFQKLSIDEARLTNKRNRIAIGAIGNLEDNFKNFIGIELDSKKGILITDIVLSEDTKKLRRMRLEGQTEAERTENTGKGYANAISAIIRLAGEHGANLKWEEAEEIFREQRGLETIGKTGSNLTFISENITGILASFLSKKKKP